MGSRATAPRATQPCDEHLPLLRGDLCARLRLQLELREQRNDYIKGTAVGKED